MQSVLLLGSKGMLGQELVRIFSADSQYRVSAWDREDIDVTNEKETRKKIMDLWPDVIINATAYNAVDLCETSEEEQKKAQTLNAKVPGLLAEIANDLQSIIVHYSTDYVFDGDRPKYRGDPKTSTGRAPGCCGSGCETCSYFGLKSFDGYREYDLPHPLSVYGRTKYEGERKVEANCQNHIIVRLSKLFGKPGAAEGAKRSFFDVILEKAKKEGKVNAVDGELSCFTYAPDLAERTKMLIEKNARGIYHIVNAGAVTWYQAAKRLFAIAGVFADVQPVSPEAFPRPAKRPSRSVLISSRIEPMRSWEAAAEEYIKRENIIYS